MSTTAIAANVDDQAQQVNLIEPETLAVHQHSDSHSTSVAKDLDHSEIEHAGCSSEPEDNALSTSDAATNAGSISSFLEAFRAVLTVKGLFFGDYRQTEPFDAAFGNLVAMKDRQKRLEVLKEALLLAVNACWDDWYPLKRLLRLAPTVDDLGETRSQAYENARQLLHCACLGAIKNVLSL